MNIHICPDAASLAPFADGLRAVERAIPYPIADGADAFTIDHGDDYAAFFQGLGEARFAVVTDDDQVVGGIAGIWRDLCGPDGPLRGVYLADLKLAPAARGRGVPARLMGRGLWEILKNPAWRAHDLFFGAAMRGARGDVTRTHRGAHVGRLGRPLATLNLWFADPRALRELPADGPALPGRCLDLSGGRPLDRVVRTTGRKDFRLRSTGAPWRLAHVPFPASARSTPIGATLAAAAATVDDDELGCFALDQRLVAPTAWLAARGLTPGAVCTVHGLPFSRAGWRAARDHDWIHLATSEI